MYSAIFACNIRNLTGRLSLGDISSTTKSGQRGGIFSCCSSVRASHRTRPGAIRKEEKGKGDECDTRPILSGPVFKVGTNVSTTSPRFSARQSHDDQFLPGREFEVKFAVVETKFD